MTTALSLSTTAGNNGFSAINEPIRLAIAQGSQIEKIQIYISSILKFDWELFDRFLLGCPNCKTLDLSYSSIDNSAIEQLADRISEVGISTLKITNIVCVGERGLQALKKVHSLEVVQISGKTTEYSQDFSFELECFPWLGYEGGV